MWIYCKDGQCTKDDIESVERNGKGLLYCRDGHSVQRVTLKGKEMGKDFLGIFQSPYDECGG